MNWKWFFFLKCSQINYRRYWIVLRDSYIQTYIHTRTWTLSFGITNCTVSSFKWLRFFFYRNIFFLGVCVCVSFCDVSSFVVMETGVLFPFGSALKPQNNTILKRNPVLSSFKYVSVFAFTFTFTSSTNCILFICAECWMKFCFLFLGWENPIVWVVEWFEIWNTNEISWFTVVDEWCEWGIPLWKQYLNKDTYAHIFGHWTVELNFGFVILSLSTSKWKKKT